MVPGRGRRSEGLLGRGKGSAEVGEITGGRTEMVPGEGSAEIHDNICKGFVNGSETFIITDNKIVMPTSFNYALDMLLNCGIKSMSSVKKVTVNVTKEKVLDLLKCSLLSKSPLTDFFLKKQSFLEWNCFSPCEVANSGLSIKAEVKLVKRKSDGKVALLSCLHLKALVVATIFKPVEVAHSL
ncbi:hypothetical protein Fmac_010998 [Flemingia macrophylla]|uniref:Uncharacterized protein n=1 Tax=Flemingia macrophylla TaxID=520843 RepID=A0ABD1ML65_9FABA